MTTHTHRTTNTHQNTNTEMHTGRMRNMLIYHTFYATPPLHSQLYGRQNMKNAKM